MKRYARIISDIVVETVDLPADISLGSVFHDALGFEEVDVSVEAGMTRSGNAFSLPNLPEPETETRTVAQRLAAFLDQNPDIRAAVLSGELLENGSRA